MGVVLIRSVSASRIGGSQIIASIVLLDTGKVGKHLTDTI